ncbi:MAG: OmpH family outer membrane protein [Bacteroidales bacterium]|nr:OmpH family outer membrane protein [Bacteroidales bacterium]
MKKILLIAALGLASVAGFAQQKFAHINFQELVTLMPEADQAREVMSASSKEAQDTYQSMVEEYQSKYTQYSQKASTWTQAIKESKEKELGEISQRIQEFEQSIQIELQQQQQELMAPIYEKANNTLQELAKKGGYVYVFDISTALYVDPSQSTDLTPAARKALNIPEGRTLEQLQKELEAQAQAEQAQ